MAQGMKKVVELVVIKVNTLLEQYTRDLQPKLKCDYDEQRVKDLIN